MYALMGQRLEVMRCCCCCCCFVPTRLMAHTSVWSINLHLPGAGMQPHPVRASSNVYKRSTVNLHLFRGCNVTLRFHRSSNGVVGLWFYVLPLPGISVNAGFVSSPPEMVFNLRANSTLNTAKRFAQIKHPGGIKSVRHHGPRASPFLGMQACRENNKQKNVGNKDRNARLYAPVKMRREITFYSCEGTDGMPSGDAQTLSKRPFENKKRAADI